MSVVPINSLAEFNTTINSDQYSVVDFWASWCGPCRAISPVFEKLAGTDQFAGLKFYKVDVDAHQDISTQVGIRAMPTFILFKNGEKVEELVGANPKGLEELLVKGV